MQQEQERHSSWHGFIAWEGVGAITKCTAGTAQSSNPGEEPGSVALRSKAESRSCSEEAHPKGVSFKTYPKG